MLGIRETKTAAIEPEGPPSIEEYARRRAEVSRLGDEADRLDVAAYRITVESAEQPAAEIDGRSFLMRSVRRGSSRVEEARKAAAEARERGNDAMVRLNQWAEANKDAIWPPDPLSAYDRAKVIRDEERRAQLAEDLRALGFTIPEATP